LHVSVLLQMHRWRPNVVRTKKYARDVLVLYRGICHGCKEVFLFQFYVLLRQMCATISTNDLLELFVWGGHGAPLYTLLIIPEMWRQLVKYKEPFCLVLNRTKTHSPIDVTRRELLIRCIASRAKSCKTCPYYPRASLTQQTLIYVKLMCILFIRSWQLNAVE